MRCTDCPRWQGIRYSQWADCHYVAFKLLPELRKAKKYNGFTLTPPLDPHDFKYVFSEDIPNIHKIPPLPTGVRLEYRKEKDVWYNENGEERIRTVKYPYFQTRYDYDCGLCASEL